jgi:transcription antitermination factor NusG
LKRLDEQVAPAYGFVSAGAVEKNTSTLRREQSFVEKLSPSEDGEAMHEIAAKPVATGASHWFAAYTTSRHEKRVALHLTQRRIEHFLPLYRAQHKWKDGSEALVDLPLFPGYVFIRIDPRDRVGVLEVPGVVSIIGTATRPAPLADDEVEALRIGLDPMRSQPHPLLRTGQRVRIKNGALAGIEGIVLRKKSGCRVVLTLDLLMQSIAIEVDGEDVDPIDTSFPLTVEATDKEIEQPQRTSLYEFKCLDSYPERSSALSSVFIPRR